MKKPRTEATVRRELNDVNIRINKWLDKVAGLKIKRSRLMDEMDEF